jgi:hypothetical protein
MVGERPWSELADERVAPTAAGSSGCARVDGLFDYVHTPRCVSLQFSRPTGADQQRTADHETPLLNVKGDEITGPLSGRAARCHASRQDPQGCAGQRSANSQPLARRRHCGVVAGEKPSLDMGLFVLRGLLPSPAR